MHQVAQHAAAQGLVLLLFCKIGLLTASKAEYCTALHLADLLMYKICAFDLLSDASIYCLTAIFEA